MCKGGNDNFSDVPDVAQESKWAMPLTHLKKEDYFGKWNWKREQLGQFKSKKRDREWILEPATL